MRIYSLIIFASLLSQFVSSQGIPSLNNSDTNTSPIVLSELHISVFVVENIATTTMEMHFYNPNDRVMEGEFNFPLSNGVTISRFALDINGEMREGVVVDKEKATQAFEAVTRRNVDPGIAEVTKGNNFKARVYPIPASGYKKAIIAFEQEINGDAEHYLYQLPLNIEHKLKKFSTRVEVVLNKPKVLKNTYPAINLEFTQARNSYISDYQETNKSLDSHLTFAIPKPQQTKKAFTYKGSVTSDNYFYTNISIKPEQRKKRIPKSITLIWDVSSSAKNRDLTKEIEILRGYLDWMNSGEINLITFSNTIHKTKTYQNIQDRKEQLFSDLKSEKYDGGTNMNAIDFSKFNSDEILLFSDGISNFGEKKSTAFKSPILAINSSNIADHNLLEHLSMSSNGAYINAFETSVDYAIEIATHEQKQFIKAGFDSQKIKDVFPTIGESITDHFSFSGKIEGEKATVTLHFGFGNEITESRSISIDNSQGINNNLGERIWAQRKLKTLLLDNDVIAIKSHGKKFNLITPNTSLIVLDAIEDYIQYEIVPPASLQDKYFDRIAIRNQKNSAGNEERMSRLCQEFNNDHKWWENVAVYNNLKKDTTRHLNNNSIPFPPSNVKAIEVEADDELLEEVIMESAGRAVSSRKKTSGEEKKEKKTPAINIAQWDSNAVYINSLKSVATQNIYAKYLELKSDYSESPSFYFDVATYMFQKSLRSEGLRVISNLAELELNNAEVLRTLGRKLYEFKFYDEAIAIFKEVLESRSFEPHSYIDLGLAYAEKGEYQKAIDNLYIVIDKIWDNDIISRFHGIELIILHDINNIIFKNRKQVDISFINPCLIKHMPVDVRIVIDWDANETDIDLWITDPNQEKCSYGNKNTRIGGRISNDITQGYGPEEFRLKNAIEGSYTIEAKFFGTRKQTLLGVVTVRAMVYTGFGTKNERKEVLTLQLEPQKGGEYKVGAIEVVK